MTFCSSATTSRAKYLVDVVGYNQVNGMPLKAAELAEAITDLINTGYGGHVTKRYLTELRLYRRSG